DLALGDFQGQLHDVVGGREQSGHWSSFAVSSEPAGIVSAGAWSAESTWGAGGGGGVPGLPTRVPGRAAPGMGMGAMRSAHMVTGSAAASTGSGPTLRRRTPAPRPGTGLMLIWSSGMSSSADRCLIEMSGTGLLYSQARMIAVMDRSPVCSMPSSTV